MWFRGSGGAGRIQMRPRRAPGERRGRADLLFQGAQCQALWHSCASRISPAPQSHDDNLDSHSNGQPHDDNHNNDTNCQPRDDNHNNDANCQHDDSHANLANDHPHSGAGCGQLQ